MLVLLQILKILPAFNIDLLEAYFDDIPADNVEEEIELLPDFILNHMGIQVELTSIQKDTLIRIVKNGSWKAAFKVTNMT